MDIKYNGRLKMLGPRTAQLFTDLYERRHPTFSLMDVREITGLQSASARGLHDSLNKLNQLPQFDDIFHSVQRTVPQAGLPD